MLDVHGPWVEAIATLKGLSLTVVFVGYLIFEFLHLKAVHFDHPDKKAQ